MEADATGQHPDRRRSPGEPGGARGDPGAARPRAGARRRRARRRCARSCRRDFALILLDVQMAGMNGFETAGLIKQHPRSRHIPIIFITAVNRDAAHVFRGYSHGAVDYLVKPFDPDILRSKVAVFIDLYLKGEKIKVQERLLREREREAARAQEPGALPPPARRHASVHLGRRRRAAGQLLEPGRALLLRPGRPATITEESFWECLHPEDRIEARALLGARPARTGPVRAAGPHSSAPATAAIGGTWRAPSRSAATTGP